ncbi:MAG: histidine phosphatase family protein [Planctomycetes bacterium]|nr:histidine phosphatase family protein [Planctomycetota bacterium]
MVPLVQPIEHLRRRKLALGDGQGRPSYETAIPGVFHGFESDIDLSELGYRQAAAAAPVIAAWKPEVIISSAMLRARRTAEPIAKACQLPLLVEPDLHERKVGNLVGSPAQPELGIWPDTLQRWVDGETSYAPEGSESFDDIRERVLPVWDRLTQTHADRSIVIVCHGIICRVLLLSLLANHTAADWARLGRVHNLSISELVGTGRDWRASRVFEVPSEVRELSKIG